MFFFCQGDQSQAKAHNTSHMCNPCRSSLLTCSFVTTTNSCLRLRDPQSSSQETHLLRRFTRFQTATNRHFHFLHRGGSSSGPLPALRWHFSSCLFALRWSFHTVCSGYGRVFKVFSFLPVCFMGGFQGRSSCRLPRLVSCLEGFFSLFSEARFSQGLYVWWLWSSD